MRRAGDDCPGSESLQQVLPFAGDRSITLVDDSYNANPDSFRAAIDVLATLPQPQLLVMGDMGEVGDQGPQFHAEAGAYARERGIIIADTKFEFGLDADGTVVLADEVLTPDSSRFWPVEGYEVGKPQPSYDKQFVRDWLRANPDSDYKLPDEVIEATIARYKDAYELLTGKAFV